MRHKFLDRLRPLPIIFSLLAIVSITIGQDAPIIQSNSRQFAKGKFTLTFINILFIFLTL